MSSVMLTEATIRRVGAGPRMSQAVIHRGVVYLTSQVAQAEHCFTDEMQAVLAKVDDLLAKVGSDRTRLLTATVYLADMERFEDMNVVWEAWIPAGSAPTRVTVETRMTAPRFRVAVQVAATVDE